MVDLTQTAGITDVATPVLGTTSWLARRRLIIAGCLYVAAGNAVAYADAGYSIFGLVFAIALALSFVVPLVVALPFSRFPLAKAFIFAIGATHFLDVTLAGPNPVAAITVALVPVAIIIAIRWGHDDVLLRSVSTAVVFATVSMLGQLVLAPTPLTPEAFAFAEEGKGKGRPYLHIILDEMGPLALMPDTPELARLQKRMRADYEKRGFALFDDTETVAGATQISLSHVFSEDGATPARHDEDGDFDFDLEGNRLLKDLHTAGYRVNVLQSSFLDLCAPAEESCRNYARSGDGAAIEAAAGTFGNRLEYALLDLHLALLGDDSVRGSGYYRTIALLGEKLGLKVPLRLYHARPPQVLELMRKTTAALPALGRGEAFVGHLLLPHFPYVLGADCALKAPDERAAPRWLSKPGSATFVRAEVEAAYWDQAACTHDALMAMIDAVTGSPDGKDAIVVVHGDHGSRILEKVADPHGEDAGASAEERRLALFTHFAVLGLADRRMDIAASLTLRDRIGVVLDELREASGADRVAAISTR